MFETAALSDPPRPWGPYDLADGRPRAVRIGPRDLWLQRRDGEIWLATAEAAPGTDPEAATEGDPARLPPLDLPWARWATADGESLLRLRPAFPDRSVVLEPERPFRLLPGARARVYVRVPLWIRVELPLRGAAGRSLVLDELPVLPLSSTWWGDFGEGELAWWLPTTARRTMQPELFQAHLAVCPLTMTNRSAEDLGVEKLSFRVAHLSLFADGNHLWADESTVTYLGPDGEGSQVDRTGRPPAEAPEARLVTPPRVPPRGGGIRARTFARFVPLPGLGTPS